MGTINHCPERLELRQEHWRGAAGTRKRCQDGSSDTQPVQAERHSCHICFPAENIYGSTSLEVQKSVCPFPRSLCVIYTVKRAKVEAEGRSLQPFEIAHGLSAGDSDLGILARRMAQDKVGVGQSHSHKDINRVFVFFMG